MASVSWIDFAERMFWRNELRQINLQQLMKPINLAGIGMATEFSELSKLMADWSLLRKQTANQATIAEFGLFQQTFNCISIKFGLFFNHHLYAFCLLISWIKTFEFKK